MSPKMVTPVNLMFLRVMSALAASSTSCCSTILSMAASTMVLGSALCGAGLAMFLAMVLPVMASAQRVTGRSVVSSIARSTVPAVFGITGS